MKKCIAMACSLVLLAACWEPKGYSMMPETIVTPHDVEQLFAVDSQTIAARIKDVKARVMSDKTGMLAIVDDARTFENTAQAFDTMNRLVGAAVALCQGIEMVHPDEAIRQAAHDAVQELEQFIIQELTNNQPVYRALRAYADAQFKTETLSDEARYYVTEALKDFKRMGLDLPAEKQAHVQALQKELAGYAQTFEVAIAQDTKKLSLRRDQLTGVDAAFIAQLPQEGDTYTVSVDYPSYDQIMNHCSVEATRKAMWHAMMNRAYPHNSELLKTVIARRDELAQLLGYPSYAALNLDDSMAHSVERVETFLDDLAARVADKVVVEMEQLQKQLPATVTLVQGKFKPWDIAYTKSHYKKKQCALDEREIAEYFPFESTLQGLLAIYEQFLSVKFVPISGHQFWHPDVKLIAVERAGARIGYLLLDLHPRPFKFTHACELGVIKAARTADGKRTPAVAIVIANFPQATAERPALFTRNDVITFFHEFGHALHEVLGATELFGFAGTSVRRDFVEMPSQMLEEWMWQPSILKHISKHYSTGKQLPDDMIERICALKQFDAGDVTQRQVALARLSLAYFKSGAKKDPAAIRRSIFTTGRPFVMVDESDHFEASFGHLMGYGAGYYGYLWSKVYALDLFAHIKEAGLLNAEIGDRYVTAILQPGGSKHPAGMLKDFLGREPSSDAFFKDLGVA